MIRATLPPEARLPGLTGGHVLALMIGFFAIVFAVNGVLLFQALSTHSGLVAQEPYRKGLDYNSRVAADERQTALGWQAGVSLGAAGSLAVSLIDSGGRPVMGLDVRGTLGRPSTSRMDRGVRLAEVEPGRYVADTGRIEGGAWLVTLEASPATTERAGMAGAPIFRLKRRLWLKP